MSYLGIIKRLHVIIAVAVPVLLACVFAAPALGAAGDDWPTSLHDVQRTAASADTTVGTATAPTLTKLWTFQTGGPVATTPTVTGGVAYFGSWDGDEYAVNAATGAQIWKTSLGTLTADPTCIPPQLGISSPATVSNGTVYVGGGDGYWYALDAATGAVDWRIWVGGKAPGTYDGHYNWSGPLIVGNYAYVGIASLGDCPLVQGQLLKVNLTTHAIENTANLVPNGQVGGGIWTSPAYNPATGLIYTATGTENLPSQQWAQAFLAIDPSTMEVVDSWKLPEYETVLDSDFGTSTTLFSSGGKNMVTAVNKNGVAYAFNQASLASGPVWQQDIAVGGDCPTCGVSSVSSGAFGGGQLYLAGNLGAINGTEYPGTVRALNPATGASIWQHGAPGSVIGALAYDNGMVLDGAGGARGAQRGHRCPAVQLRHRVPDLRGPVGGERDHLHRQHGREGHRVRAALDVPGQPAAGPELPVGIYLPGHRQPGAGRDRFRLGLDLVGHRRRRRGEHHLGPVPADQRAGRR